jgi:hypothetical protein
VALEAEQRVLAIHAAAVVGDGEKFVAAAVILDIDARRAGVEAVLDEFLEHGGRPFDHLAGRDLAGHGVGQQSDASHFNARRPKPCPGKLFPVQFFASFDFETHRP